MTLLVALWKVAMLTKSMMTKYTTVIASVIQTVKVIVETIDSYSTDRVAYLEIDGKNTRTQVVSCGGLREYAGISANVKNVI